MEIGNRIKTLRMINGLTLEELASRCELTKGFLSQIERGLNAPSISTLEDICDVLGVSLAEFFTTPEVEKTVYKKEDFFIDEKDGTAITWLIANAQSRSMEPIIVTLAPGASSQVMEPHDGEEFGYVLTGRIILSIDGSRQMIKKDEAFYLSGKQGHYFTNETGVEARYIWVSNPPLF